MRTNSVLIGSSDEEGPQQASAEDLATLAAAVRSLAKSCFVERCGSTRRCEIQASRLGFALVKQEHVKTEQGIKREQGPGPSTPLKREPSTGPTQISERCIATIYYRVSLALVFQHVFAHTCC